MRDNRCYLRVSAKYIQAGVIEYNFLTGGNSEINRMLYLRNTKLCPVDIGSVVFKVPAQYFGEGLGTYGYGQFRYSVEVAYMGFV